MLQDMIKEKRCWGYEQGCLKQNAYSTPACNDRNKGWVKSKEEHENRFYDQADFGYIKRRLQEMRIMCEPLFRVISIFIIFIRGEVLCLAINCMMHNISVTG